MITPPRHETGEPWAPEPRECEVEAAARWLMEDDSAYADQPEAARRAAREMLRAAALAVLSR